MLEDAVFFMVIEDSIILYVFNENFNHIFPLLSLPYIVWTIKNNGLATFIHL